MRRKLSALLIATTACVATALPAAATMARFDDPLGDGGQPGTRLAGMDIDHYRIAYNDARARITIHFTNLKSTNYRRVIWYVNPVKDHFGKVGVILQHSGRILSVGTQPCPRVAASRSLSRDVAVLTFPASCVNSAASVRVLLGVEASRGEDWNDHYSPRVYR